MSIKDENLVQYKFDTNDEHYYEGGEGDGNEDDLVDAEELTNKKKLTDKNASAERPSSQLSQGVPASISQDSLIHESDNIQSSTNSLKKSILKLDNNLVDRKRNEILKSSSSRRQSVEIDFANDYLNIKTIKSNNSNKLLYPVSAEKFSQFESLLFDLVGFTNTPYKTSDLESKKTTEFLKDDYSNTQFIPNMESLTQKLEINPANRIQLKKNVPQKNSNSQSNKEKDFESIECEQKLYDMNYKAKLVTVILNQSIRPRKAGRILLTKRNTANLDSILNEIGNFFKTESIRKLFNLSGVQIYDPIDMYYQDDVFIAFTNDKIHNKDFDLEPEEVNIFYANEYMKIYSNLNPAKVYEKSGRKSSLNSLKKAKQTESLIEHSKNDIELMPEDLLDNYEIGPVIGEGHYAIVRECKDINTGILFALKIIDLKKCNGKENMIENELNILRKVIHPNIVKLVEEYKSREFVYLIFEYYKAGDLLESVRKRAKFLEKDASPMIYSLAAALSHLHSLNIVHRDVKLDNILIQQYPDGSKSLKLGDFGLATIVNGPLNQKCGSPVYVAPEILFGKEYGFEVDVWSLGIIAYILLCGYAPFQGQTDDETLTIIKNDELKFVNADWEKISPECIDLIKKMLDRNQVTRIKAADILNHNWFTRENNKSMENSEQSLKENSLVLNKEITNMRKQSQASRTKTAENRTLLTQTKRSKNYKASNILIPPTFESSSVKIDPRS